MLFLFSNRVILSLAFFVFIIISGKAAMAIEEPEYTVIENPKSFGMLLSSKTLA
jgi:hypothetical protein